jgi:hypothetical protein
MNFAERMTHTISFSTFSSSKLLFLFYSGRNATPVCVLALFAESTHAGLHPSSLPPLPTLNISDRLGDRTSPKVGNADATRFDFG